MTTRSTETIKKLAGYLSGTARGGIHNDDDAYPNGVPIAFDGTTPTQRIPLTEVERRIAALSDDPDHVRQKIQLRLGLAPYSAWPSQRRASELERMYDATPADRRGVGYRSPAVPRVDVDELARTAARAILDGPAISPPPTYDYTRLLYSRSIALPSANRGEVIEVHRRIIQSHVKNLTKITIHQTEHWDSSSTAGAEGMGDVTLTPVRIRSDDKDGMKGERLDLEISFPPLNPEDGPRELTWVRTRTVKDGWLGDTRTFTVSSTPDRPTETMVIEVKFAPDATPIAILEFSDVYDGDRNDPDLPFRVRHATNGAIRSTWDQPTVGRASGIRIAW